MLILPSHPSTSLPTHTQAPSKVPKHPLFSCQSTCPPKKYYRTLAWGCAETSPPSFHPNCSTLRAVCVSQAEHTCRFLIHGVASCPKVSPSVRGRGVTPAGQQAAGRAFHSAQIHAAELIKPFNSSLNHSKPGNQE